LPIFLTTFSTHIIFISFWLVLAKKEEEEEAVAQFTKWPDSRR
jgi:hypothetical protein